VDICWLKAQKYEITYRVAEMTPRRGSRWGKQERAVIHIIIIIIIIIEFIEIKAIEHNNTIEYETE